DEIAPPPGTVGQAGRSGGWLLGPETNDAFVAVNRLLAAGHEVHRLTGAVRADRRTYAPGSFYIPNAAGVQPMLESLAADVGLSFDGVSSRPQGEAVPLRPVRIGLWDRYGGSMPSGWIRWIFERYGFDFDVVFPQELDAGGLNAKYDVLVFVTGAIPAPGEGQGGAGGRGPAE